MLPSTVDRVPRHTAEHINQRIRHKMQRDVERAVRGGPREIERRLAELDREWDIERTLEANASTVILAGLGLGISVDRRFLALPILAGGFLLMHALQGWCPPLPIFRRLGVRTASEIEEERRMLLVESRTDARERSREDSIRQSTGTTSAPDEGTIVRPLSPSMQVDTGAAAGQAG
ncbi:hypothetical protein [Propionivibrio soli]|jgi:hypothetical protein|uniref:hypothetical protein n=1 Tax=Propionivibrio soli TaxID=2976531 RepID=UPI0021E7330E|nr:hypothetical protein [Propionivibrio soli]